MRNLYRSFERSGVEYLLISGQASVLYGAALFSEDIDIWLRPAAENVTRFLRALASCRATVHKLTPPMTVRNLRAGHGFHFIVPSGEGPVYLDVMGQPPRVGPFARARRRARIISCDYTDRASISAIRPPRARGGMMKSGKLLVAVAGLSALTCDDALPTTNVGGLVFVIRTSDSVAVSFARHGNGRNHWIRAVQRRWLSRSSLAHVADDPQRLARSRVRSRRGIRRCDQVRGGQRCPRREHQPRLEFSAVRCCARVRRSEGQRHHRGS